MNNTTLTIAGFTIFVIASFVLLFLQFYPKPHNTHPTAAEVPSTAASDQPTAPTSSSCPPSKSYKETITLDFLAVYFGFDQHGKIRVDPKYTDVILDIGANKGQETIGLSQTSPTTLVLAFEPIHILQQGLYQHFGAYPNIQLLPCAVGPTSFVGVRQFNIAGQEDSSSLLSFNQEGVDKWLAGYGENDRKSIFHTNPQAVIVIDIAVLVDALPFDKITKIWLDAQGMDLNIIKGLRSDQLRKVQWIQFEWIYPNTVLYNGLPNETHAQIIEYFKQHDLKFVSFEEVGGRYGDYQFIHE